jgi:hypothetical protein
LLLAGFQFWNPARSAIYIESSVPESWNPGRAPVLNTWHFSPNYNSKDTKKQKNLKIDAKVFTQNKN